MTDLRLVDPRVSESRALVVLADLEVACAGRLVDHVHPGVRTAWAMVVTSSVAVGGSLIAQWLAAREHDSKREVAV